MATIVVSYESIKVKSEDELASTISGLDLEVELSKFCILLLYKTITFSWPCTLLCYSLFVYANRVNQTKTKHGTRLSKFDDISGISENRTRMGNENR